MKFTFNKELASKIGSVTWTLGKAIFIEGVKGVLLKSATKAITTSFDGGIEGVKKLTLDDYVGRKKKHVEVPNIKSDAAKAALKRMEDRATVDAEFEIVERRDQD